MQIQLLFASFAACGLQGGHTEKEKLVVAPYLVGRSANFLEMSGSGLPGVLSDELWSKIFLLVGSNAAHTRPDVMATLDYDEAAILLEYRRFHHLRLACKRFNTIFQDQPGLSATILLSTKLCVPSLLRRIQMAGASVQTLVLFCGSPFAELALAALSTAGPTMTTVLACQVSDCLVPVLSAFTSLTTCNLNASGESAVDLSPLKALPSLCKLSLQQGHFVSIQAAAFLSLEFARVQGGPHCPFVHTLKQLHLRASSLLLFRSSLSACTALQGLQCLGSAIKGGQGNEHLDLRHDSVTALPLGLSLLTGLTSIKFLYEGQLMNSDPWHLSQISTLTQLQSLELRKEDSCIGLSKYFSSLQQLTKLSVHLKVTQSRVCY